MFAGGYEIVVRDYSGRRFRFGVGDLLSADTDAIVSPVNGGLSHGGGLAAVICNEAGPRYESACEKIIEKYGPIKTTWALPSSAGNLPFKGIVNAVGPRMSDDDVRGKQERTIINSLRVADRMKWRSVAFPALGTGLFLVPAEICAEAFKGAMERYWVDYPESLVSSVDLYLTIDDYPVFKRII